MQNASRPNPSGHHGNATNRIFHTICRSILDLLDPNLDDVDPDRSKIYHNVADYFYYDPMGVPETKEDDLAFEQYRSGDLGTLAERKWEDRITWKIPDN